MADGALSLVISEAAASQLAAEAEARGIAPEALAAEVLNDLFVGTGREWIGDDPATTPLEEPDPDEPVHELEDVLAEFSAELERRLALKA